MTAENLIYLDNAATTPVEPAVAEAMSAALRPGGQFGNPSSNHELGRDALAIVETMLRISAGGTRCITTEQPTRQPPSIHPLFSLLKVEG